MHPRVFVTKDGIAQLRDRARTSHAGGVEEGPGGVTGAERGSAAAARSAGAPLPEQRGVRDRRREPGLRRRAASRIPRGGEEVDARRDRLRALGLHLQQAERRSCGGSSPICDRLGVRSAARAISTRPSGRASGARSNGMPGSCTSISRRRQANDSTSPRTTTSSRRRVSR